MKAKELKEYLSLIKDEEDIMINIGSITADLASIGYNGKCITLCSSNYGCDNNKITISEMAKYLRQKRK